jgi:hypothetical protein
VGIFLELSDQRAHPWQRHVEIIDPEKQEEAVARLRVIGADQRGMLMGAPPVKAEQDRSIRVEDLTEVPWAGAVSGMPNNDWYHLKLPVTSPTPMIVHVRLMGFLPRPSR